MEELPKRHRQEQRDLQSRITQKKRSATKKTRKFINDECTEMERQLKETQEKELAEVGGHTDTNDQIEEASLSANEENSQPLQTGTHSEDAKIIDAHVSTALSQGKKPNRQKARLARRAAEQEAAATKAAEEASNLPDRREEERLVMSKELEKRGLIEKEIRSDGHCLYSAIADQLAQEGVGILPDPKFSSQLEYKAVRQMAAEYISSHPEDFAPFLEEPLDVYVRKIKDTGEWGGQLELSALANAYGLDINVLQGDGRIEKITAASGTTKEVWLGYYRHSFGLGEHYNSLRKTHRP
ncbi:MAG: hypothetical protein MMC33_002754 [Icmadophila ericetorum]|nr:hypothetical protein [Icmadophila ericetorum]